MNIEDSDEYRLLDLMLREHELDPKAPPRKGAQAFSWDFVKEEAQKLLVRCTDLRVAVWLLRALIKTEGFAGLAQGLRVIDEILIGDPDAIYPKADVDDMSQDAGDDLAAQTRGLALAWLGAPSFGAAVQGCWLPGHQELSLQRWLAREGEAGLAANLRADGFALEALASDALSSMAALERVASLFAQMGQGGIQGVSEGVLSVLQRVRLMARPEAVQPLVQQLDSIDGIDATEAVTGRAADARLKLSDRAGVRRVLDELQAYYCEVEPGHPSLILIQRLQKMVGASFGELMRELYGEGDRLVARLEKPFVN